MEAKERFKGLGLTFDDVLLRPGLAVKMPHEVEIGTDITASRGKKRAIKLNIPIVSAAMDTVTEFELAIAVDLDGGIGIIHRNLSPGIQAGQVERVKRWMNALIPDPYTCTPEQTVEEVSRYMIKCRVAGLPVIGQDRELLGIVTHKDVESCPVAEMKTRRVTEIMTRELVTANEGVTPQEAEQRMMEKRVEKLPVIRMDGKKKILVGLYTRNDIRKRSLYPQVALDGKGRLLVGAAVGDVWLNNQERVDLLVKAGVDVIVVDTAHGDNLKNMKNMLERLNERYPTLPVIAGNVVTAQAAQDLIDWGADAIKVGMGPSAICTTRVITGVGMAQFSAILECAEVCHKAGVPLIADGGIRYSGDIVKALAAGASSVMIGSLFAGTDESPGEIIPYQGKNYKIYRGMGSISAMQEGSAERYKQGDVKDRDKLIAEGIEGRTPIKGALANVVYQLMGGLRAGMGYCGAERITDLWETSYMQVTAAGVRESHPHDIIITESAPNYPMGGEK
ncbi:MAG: IMP dehydrogenase [Patescibacteria group bacterium]